MRFSNRCETEVPEEKGYKTNLYVKHDKLIKNSSVDIKNIFVYFILCKAGSS